MHAHVAQIGADRGGHPDAAQSLVVLTANGVAVNCAAVQSLREIIVLEQRGMTACTCSKRASSPLLSQTLQRLGW